MSRGIDYSGPGATCNRDPKTGIRYGIIHSHKLGDGATESFEEVYTARCPHCGGDLPEDTQFTRRSVKRPGGILRFEQCADCPACGKLIREDEQFGDEADDNVLDNGEYQARLDSSGDAWFFKSPYFTRAAFCSPYALGACHLSSPCDDGERAYCPGHDWFDEDKAPFPIYSVATGERVLSSPEICERDQAISPYNKIGGGKLSERRDKLIAAIMKYGAVTLEWAPEDLTIEGNCSAIDEKTDREQEKWVHDQLDAGNEWAWCTAVVRVNYHAFSGEDVLGACSYLSEENFRECDYFTDMVRTASADLADQLLSAETVMVALLAKHALACQMRETCTSAVTHIDNSGFVYCTNHGKQRQQYKACRKMTKPEMSKLKAGETISYRKR